MAKSTVPVPDDAFTKPTSEEMSGNPEYWSGYRMGQTRKTIIPGPAGYDDYYAYKADWELYYKPATDMGYPIQYNVGFNNAICDAGNWLWINDPKSPHNVVS